MRPNSKKHKFNHVEILALLIRPAISAPNGAPSGGTAWELFCSKI
jgi:hypothetical protein